MPRKRYIKTVNFSVSSNNLDVIEILKLQKNKSDFICEAIREKQVHDSGGITERMTEKQRALIREEIKSLIFEIFGENVCLYGYVGNAPSIPVGMAPYIPSTETSPPKHEEPKPNDDSSDENLSLLSDIFSSL